MIHFILCICICQMFILSANSHLPMKREIIVHVKPEEKLALIRNSMLLKK